VLRRGPPDAALENNKAAMTAEEICERLCEQKVKRKRW
jgi:hypothetical protein